VDELRVVVRDEGKGIGPRPDSPGLGLGLPLIASLTESVELGRDEEERTEVRMTFLLTEPLHHYGAVAHRGAANVIDPPAGS
ncbi:MAG: ATP-binding protein, partial [Solirubrobacteraceae bacterium]